MTGDFLNHATWTQIGSTADGQPIRTNPATGLPGVFDPVTGMLYAPSVYQRLLSERMRRAAEDMLAALKGIEADAHEAISDACADVQEGGSGEALNRALAKWQPVLTAIAKAEGKR